MYRYQAKVSLHIQSPRFYVFVISCDQWGLLILCFFADVHVSSVKKIRAGTNVDLSEGVASSLMLTGGITACFDACAEGPSRPVVVGNATDCENSSLKWLCFHSHCMQSPEVTLKPICPASFGLANEPRSLAVSDCRVKQGMIPLGSRVSRLGSQQ